ncbi:MAG: PaeR7I family type II restriction endonuclease [Gammaproteobacteria bacterium]
MSGSNSPVRAKEPHFKVFPGFWDASYAKRYELFALKAASDVVQYYAMILDLSF